MKHLRLFVVSLLALAAIPMTAAVWASPPSSPDGVQRARTPVGPPVTIRFFHAMRGQRGVQLERITKRYEELHPGIHVEIKAVLDVNQRTGNDYSALYRGVLESLAQKNPPEVSQLYENWVSQLIEVEALQPLDQDLSGLIQDLSPAFKALCRSADGKYYSVPFNKSVWVLYYNKDMFAKAGVNPPKTWEELRQVSTAIAKATGKPGLVFRPGVDVFSLRFLADGGSYLDAQGKPTFNTATAASALAYWVDMVHQDRSCLPTLKSLEVFAQGNAGMLLDTTSKLGRLESEASLNLGAASLPAGSRSAPLLAGTNLGVFRVKDPARQKAALDFAAFLTSPEVQVEWCEDSGYLPVRKAALLSADYQKFLGLHPNHSVGVQALPHVVSQPEVAGWESVRGLLDDAFYAALSRQSTPHDALTRACSLALELLSELKGGAPAP